MLPSRLVDAKHFAGTETVGASSKQDVTSLTARVHRSPSLPANRQYFRPIKTVSKPLGPHWCNDLIVRLAGRPGSRVMGRVPWVRAFLHAGCNAFHQVNHCKPNADASVISGGWEYDRVSSH